MPLHFEPNEPNNFSRQDSAQKDLQLPQHFEPNEPNEPNIDPP